MQPASPSLLTSRPANLAASLLLASLWSVFALGHISAWQRSADWTYLVFVAAESLGALLFLLRTTPVAVSSHAGDWLAGMGGTFGVFLFAPTEWGLLPQARLLVVAGCLLQIAGLLSLNRSFGLVAARRSIKTGGMYRLVRHPLYASYLLGFTGYALANSSWRNLAVACGVMLLLVLRLLREEHLLRQDAGYRAYMRQVPYRLLPLIF